MKSLKISDTVQKKFERMRKTINLQKPDRMPTTNDWEFIEYRKEEYHLGEPELPVPEGKVVVSTDGKKKYTSDGGVWTVGDKEAYKDFNDVLKVNLEKFEIETVGQTMRYEMARLYNEKAKTHFPVPLHYGTLFTRATIEFGWEPFLMALAMDPKTFGKILDRFGQASLAVIQGWAQTDDIELICVHDDIAGTRGILVNPAWYREYVFPWHKRLFAAIHEKGRKVLYISDGNYTEVLDAILETKPDGLYIESTSIDPEQLMRNAGRDKLYLLKSDTRNIDFGTPKDIYNEIKKLRKLHEEFPGIIMYRGGNRKEENVQAFERYYKEMLVYE